MTAPIYRSLTFPESPVRYTAEDDPISKDFVILRNAETGRKIGTIARKLLATGYEKDTTPGASGDEEVKE